jgi:hypothetical protein
VIFYHFNFPETTSFKNQIFEKPKPTRKAPDRRVLFAIEISHTIQNDEVYVNWPWLRPGLILDCMLATEDFKISSLITSARPAASNIMSNFAQPIIC